MSAAMKVMGILNLTPDSFSDGGKIASREDALERALAMERDGADFIDIGGESTRPGATPIDAETEIARIGEALKAIVKAVKIPVTVDTYHPETARFALGAGAAAVNCVKAEVAAEMCRIAAGAGAWAILPAECAADADDGKFALPPERIVFDPMVGFGDGTPEDDLDRLFSVRELAKARRVLVGASRKRFVRWLVGENDVSKTAAGDIAVARWCAKAGVEIVRVHDVRGTVAALRGDDAGFSVRRAALRDAESIFALVHLNRDQLVPRSIGNIVENIDRFFVAVSGADIIGCVSYQVHPEIGSPLDATVEIQSLAVRSPYRRRGVGKALVEAVMAAIGRFSPKEAIVLTFAPEFFSALGFREIPKTKVMHKLYTGCINCTKHTNPFTCPEIAMVRETDAAVR